MAIEATLSSRRATHRALNVDEGEGDGATGYYVRTNVLARLFLIHSRDRFSLLIEIMLACVHPLAFEQGIYGCFEVGAVLKNWVDFCSFWDSYMVSNSAYT
jgi:hypothetical protein